MKFEYYYLATCLLKDGRRKRKKIKVPVINEGLYDTRKAYRQAEEWLDNQKDSYEGKIMLKRRIIKEGK